MRNAIDDLWEMAEAMPSSQTKFPEYPEDNVSRIGRGIFVKHPRYTPCDRNTPSGRITTFPAAVMAFLLVWKSSVRALAISPLVLLGSCCWFCPSPPLSVPEHVCRSEEVALERATQLVFFKSVTSWTCGGKREALNLISQFLCRSRVTILS